MIPGVVDELSPLVRRVLAPNPGMMTGPGTNTYLVGGADLAVVDPGPADDAHLDAVAGAGGGRIRWILAMHTHRDHAPGVAGLQERTGAEVLGFDARDNFSPDRAINDGFVVDADGFRLRAVHTPGHASNHLCYLLEDEQLLFSGDHVMDGSTVVIRPPDGDMAAYLQSLERVRGLGLRAIAPGHGRLITDPDARVDQYLLHRRQREQAIMVAVRDGAPTIPEIVQRVYIDVPEDRHPIAQHSVYAHLLKLRDEGRVSGEDFDGEWKTT